MKFAVRLLIGAVTMLVLMIGGKEAKAQPKRLLVLVDATGSMTQPCTGEPPACTGQTRFELAKTLAAGYVATQAGSSQGLLDVAVYTFDGGQGFRLRTTGGFVTPGGAVTAINNLVVSPFNTPLANSLCRAVDVLIADNNAAIPHKLAFFTDGGENASAGECSGPYTDDAPPNNAPPYAGGSWHNLVYLKLVNATPVVEVDTYFFTSNVGFAGGKSSNPIQEQGAPVRAASCAPGQPCIQVTDSQFFADLSRDTGGQFTEIEDDDPLPIFGDVDGDGCVTRTDALLVARQFNRAPDRQFDVDDDGVIGFRDYDFVASRIGQGCLAPPADPYVASGPLTCPANGGTLTIQGKAVTGSSFAVTGGHTCRIVIKNSLIVGDLAAISMNGNNRVTVDNSIVVGNGVIGVNGFTELSAANTIFHGAKLPPTGAMYWVDRGGNTWEE